MITQHQLMLNFLKAYLRLRRIRRHSLVGVGARAHCSIKFDDLVILPAVQRLGKLRFSLEVNLMTMCAEKHSTHVIR